MYRNLKVSQHLGFWLRRHPLSFPVGWTPLFNEIHPRGRPPSYDAGPPPFHNCATFAPPKVGAKKDVACPGCGVAKFRDPLSPSSVSPSSRVTMRHLARVSSCCCTQPSKSRKGGGPASALQTLGGPVNGEELVLRNLNFHCTFKFKSDRSISRWRDISLASPREAIASANSLNGVSHCATAPFVFEKLNCLFVLARSPKSTFQFSICVEISVNIVFIQTLKGLVMSFFTGNKRGRRVEKIEKVVGWLAQFDYSTGELIGRSIGVDYRGQSAFFKTLLDDGIIVRDYIPGTRLSVYSLGSDGFGLASMYYPELVIREKKKKPSLITLVHTFSIQSLIISLLPVIDSFKSEKALQALNLARRPDAIVMKKDGKRIAIEVEINRKATDKIYFNYVNHIRDIKSEFYDSVAYYFNDDSVCNIYKAIYETPRWPVFKKNPSGGRLIKLENSFDPEAVFEREFFTFTVKDMYTL